MKYIYIICFFVAISISSFAQTLQDDFSDGDFTANPVWTGTTTDFIVNGGNVLQTDNLGNSATSQLSTAAAIQDSTTWEFLAEMQFDPSTSNYTKIYLQADNATPDATSNGYYLQIGSSGSSDSLELYRVDAGTPTKILGGTAAAVALSPNVRVRVIRDNTGLWSLFADYTGGTTYVLEGTVLDATYPSGSHFGIWTRYTTTRGDKFFFDDIYVSPLLVDITPPAIDSAVAINGTAVDVYFDEPVDATTANLAANYTIDNGITVNTATIDGTNPTLVHLTTTALTSATNYLLTANAVEDLNANPINNGTANFVYYNIQTATFQDVIINEIFADETPVVGLPSAEYVEIYNISNKYIQLGGMLLNDGSDKVLPTFILEPDSVVILTANSNLALFSSFGTALGLSSLSLTNGGELLTLKDNGGTTVDTANFDLSWYQDAIKEQGGWSLELINPTKLCIGADNWIASSSPTGGTPGQQNSVFNNTPDAQAPSLTSADFTNSTTVELIFDETLGANANLVSNYTISGGLTVTNAVFTAPNMVTLTLGAAMTSPTAYTITVTTLEDCSGNAIGVNNTDNFTFYNVQPAAFQDIIINEIFADESPAVGLPNAEFVEILNRSNKYIQLGGMLLNDGSDKTLPSFILAPDSMAILVTNAAVALYSPLGTTLNIGSLSLSNGGELLVFKDQFGAIIDTVNYNIAWYQDAAKDDGGWSLELINPTQVCIGADNWIASNDVDGGTPGKQNSVFNNTPDTQGPSLVNATFIDSVTIQLTFDETLGANATTISNYTVSGGATVTGATFMSPYTVTLTLAANMTDNTGYTATVTGLADCTGNVIGTNNTGNFTFYFVQMADVQDLIINEIMADPTPQVALPAIEYVEVYNRSNKTLDLANYIINDGSNHTLPSQIMPPNSYAIIVPSSAVSSFAGIGTVVGINSLSLSNTGELLTLANANGTVIDFVNYSSDWYQDPAKDDGGWSLELINPGLLCKEDANWIASVSSFGGSPAAQNSVFDNTADTQGPKITKAHQLATNQILIEFDDVMDNTLASNAANYSINAGNVVVAVFALSGSNQYVLTLAANMTGGTVYTIGFNNITDCVGNLMAVGSTDVTYYETDSAAHYDIIINEIMADPNPVVGLPEKEYIELYNRSNKSINLADFTFNDGSTVAARLPFYILQPQTHVLVYSNSDTISFASFGDVLAVNSFPDLNTSDDLVLYNPSGSVVDAVSYELDWYQNSDKDDGGWSLERVNPNRPCEGRENWRASIDLLGGTPCTDNSILTTELDEQAPDALRAFPLGPDSIRVYFSEALDDAAAIDINNYSIDNSITIKRVELEAPFYNSVVLVLNNPILLGIEYEITMLIGLTDCIGNPILLNNKARIALPSSINKGDLILNELLSNPVTGGSDFIELYNTSNKVLNTADLVISNAAIVGGNLANANSLQTSAVTTNWLIYPNEYVVITEDDNQVKAQYTTPNPNNFVENNLPTFADKEGSVFVYAAYDSTYIDAFGNTLTAYLVAPLDTFDYNDDMHSPLIDDLNGVSLERIDFDAPTNDPNNWHSASTDVGYATPAYQNSSFMVNDIIGDDLIELPTETVSPDGDGYEDFLLMNYNVDDLGYVANIDIYDANGRLVRTLVNGELLMREGTLQWDGTDNLGRKARVGIHIIAVTLFRPDGASKRFKKTCIVAGKM